MFKTRTPILNFVAALALPVLAGGPALADDTELFLGEIDAASAAQPNILFIMDTSGSMDSVVTTKSIYDPTIDYPGSCADDRVYWREGPGNPPGCGSSYWFNRNALMCDSAIDAFASSGLYTDRTAQFDGQFDQRWEQLRTSTKDRLVECRGDRGVHGDGSGGNQVYAQDGDGSNPWSNKQADEVSWTGSNTGRTYTLYDANYINWFYDTTITITSDTRINIIRQVTTQLLDSLKGVNVGLMRFNWDQGGPVLHAIEDIATARDSMKATVAALDADGWTPLSETLYEAGQYYMGRSVLYGNVGPNLSEPDSREASDTNTYAAPVNFECQKNYIVLLTDGAPTQDVDADDRIASLPNYGSLVGPACSTGLSGGCLDDMAKYLFEADIDPNLDGQQNVTTYTIGFNINLGLLQDTANKGGGEFYPADDAASLITVLSNIVREILEDDTTFVSPTVSVNAFNRTQTLNELFVAVFRPASEEHWPGNIKKYKLIDGKIVGVDGTTDVVDPATGFFKDNAHSFWSATADGSEVTAGGAANQLPDPASRKVYTYLGDGNLTAPVNRFSTANPDLLTYVDGRPGWAAGNTCPSRNCQIIQFMRGLDVKDGDQDGSTADQRNRMGDPLHARPVSVIYGGTEASPDLDDAVIYSANNDAILHALDPVTGEELWSFVPQELLDHLPRLYDNDPTTARFYGLDGNLQSFKYDVDGDGIVEPLDGDRVFLFFGMRRGGENIYALDVTRKNQPVLMWTKNSADYPGLGQTWSTPVPTRVEIAGSGQNASHFVLIFGGGYDSSQDNDNYSTDGSGNSIYIVDALSGALLWRASDSGANFNHVKMVNSFPSDIRVLDINGDRYADRMYAADMGGRVWRFDITKGNGAGSLVAGGVFAELGAAHLGSPDLENTRRFYYAPDAALITTKSSRFMHLGIGSGYRAHPLETANENAFFALRDKNPFTQLTQAQYNAFTPIRKGDLIDVTTDPNPSIPATADGWHIDLRLPAWQGEKVLSEARTFADRVFFTTFTPRQSENPCLPGLGVNKLFVVNAEDGSPVSNLDGVGGEDDLTVEDRIFSLSQGGIAPEIVFLFPGDDACPSGSCDRVYGFVGVEGVGGLGLPPYVRTYWNQEDTE